MATHISILTPSYNYARFLPDALTSVGLQETNGDVEHVVVDDGSSDGSIALLESWPAPLVLHAKQNEGQSATLNTALSLASGAWIGWLNSDDFYLPGALAEIEGLADGAADVIHGDSVFVDVDARVLRLVPGHEMNARVLRRYGPFMHVSSVFVRRAVLAESPWDPDLRQLLDWDLWLRLVDEGARFQYVPRVLSAFRWHREQVSRNVTRDDQHEYTSLARRFGVPLGENRSRLARAAGKIEHATMKLRAGAYSRQWRVARTLRGEDVRWFESPTARRNAERLRLGVGR